MEPLFWSSSGSLARVTPSVPAAVLSFSWLFSSVRHVFATQWQARRCAETKTKNSLKAFVSVRCRGTPASGSNPVTKLELPPPHTVALVTWYDLVIVQAPQLRYNRYRWNPFFALAFVFDRCPSRVFFYRVALPVVLTFIAWMGYRALPVISTRVDEGRESCVLLAISMNARAVVGRGEKSLLDDPESELPLGKREGEEKARRKYVVWTKNRKILRSIR